MASRKCYDKKPLDPRERSIRLIELVKPSEGTEENFKITLVLHSVSLASCPQFTALSYTWGASDDARTVIVDEDEYPIRKNLWDFLGSAHARSNPYFFWIDAISIDQGNISERNQQVTMMRDIYSVASSVFVWLGLGNDDSETAINFMLKQQSRGYWSKSHAQSILSLFEHDYWSRMWIIQEFLLARHLTILCGARSFDWDALKTAREFLEWKLSNDNEETDPAWAYAILKTNAFKIIVDRLTLEDQPAKKKGSPLSHLVKSYRDMKCAVDQDKIYALLGLTIYTENIARRDITIDYRMSISDLCDQTLQHVFPKSKPSSPDEKQEFVILLRQSLNLVGQPLSTITADILYGNQQQGGKAKEFFLQFEQLKLSTEKLNDDYNNTTLLDNPLRKLLRKEKSEHALDQDVNHHDDKASPSTSTLLPSGGLLEGLKNLQSMYHRK